VRWARALFWKKHLQE